MFTAYTLVYLFAASIAALTAVFAWRRRAAPGGFWMFLMMAAATEWALAEAFDFSVTTLPAHIVFAQLSYLGATTAPVFFMMFALAFTGQPERMPARTVWLLLGVPAATILAAFTNGDHQLVWPAFTLLQGQPNIIIYEHGPLYWVITLYGLGLTAVGTMLLVSFAIQARNLFSYQSAAIILAVAIPWVATLAYSLEPGKLPGIDPAITVIASGAILTAMMYRFKLFDVVPIARATLIEEMTDGLIVLDQDARLLEVNPAAVRLLELCETPRPGQAMVELFRHWPEGGRQMIDALYDRVAKSLVTPAGRHLGVEHCKLREVRGALPHDLFMLRDVTAQVHAEQALQKAYADLQLRVSEIEDLQAELREQTIRDPLTGLHNRRHLSETLSRELGRASREGYPVSVVIFDIDRFKHINDEYGHPAGDAVLQIVGAELRARTRIGDIICRYGGDEFVVVLPNTTVASAVERAERLRISLRQSMSAIVDGMETTTASFGVAGYPTHGATKEELIAAADTAVYAAKAGGRNRVAVAYAATAEETAPVSLRAN